MMTAHGEALGHDGGVLAILCAMTYSGICFLRTVGDC